LSAGQDLTLYGSDLEVSGQLGAGANLSLLTDGAITVRDTPTEAFVAQAGGDLTLRGNQGIDILALQHLEQTPFVSGGDLTFISDGVMSADAHFDSGGALRFSTTTGLPADVVSLYDLIMSPAGGLTMGDYTGTALKVETDGDIQMGNITITGPDTNLTADGSGSDIDLLASSRAAILRAGVNEAGNQIGVQPSNIVVGNINTSDETGGDGGPIILAASGNIETGNLNSRSFSELEDSGNGGAIKISSTPGDIITNYISANSYAGSGYYTAWNAGNGGTIAISAQGNIDTGEIRSSSAGGNSVGNGGDVTISTEGNINVKAIDSSSLGVDITVNASATVSTGEGDLYIPVISAEGGQYLVPVISAESSGGTIAISAQGNIDTGEIRSSSAGGNIVGNGGDVTISTEGNINVKAIDSSSLGVDVALNGGDITINATDTVFLGEGGQDFVPVISAEASGTGRPGNITINTPNFVLSETARITTASQTANLETRGSITLNANQMTLTGTLNIWPGGGLILQPYQTNPDLQMTLAPGAVMAVTMFRDNLAIRADGNVTISGPGRLAVESLGGGPVGNIDVTAQQLTLTDEATFAVFAVRAGEGGNLNFGVSDAITIQGNSRISLTTEASWFGAGGLNVDTGSFRLADGAQVSVSSNGRAFGKALAVTAEQMSLTNGAALISETDTGLGANIILEVDDRLHLQDNSRISALTASGTGGDIHLRLNTLQVDNSAITSSAQTGRAGNVSIEARDSVTLSNNSVLSVETRAQQDSNRTNNRSNLRLAESSLRVATTTTMPQAGNLFINSGQLLVNDGSSIFMRSLNGIAGNIDMVVGQIILDDGQIRATTAENPNNDTLSANINMSNLDFLFLDNDSLISAEAQPGANGGNIRLNADEGFIGAAPNSNSDIIATTVDGTGGQIQITSSGLFNLQGGQGGFDKLRGNQTNDISVTSIPGTDGTIEIIELDPFGVAVDLPVDTGPPLLSQGCQPGNDGRGVFVNTGQGGIAISPDDPISGDRHWEDISPPLLKGEVVEVTEAEMWQVNENGQIVLNVASSVESTSLTCQS
ncbi:MAG: hypothetical protein AAGD25_36675, partial [Cyanobacteria bacterium P01_F01_bin.150]